MKMWGLITYHAHDNHDVDYGTPHSLSNMFSPAHWGSLEILAPLKTNKQKNQNKKKPKNQPPQKKTPKKLTGLFRQK